jgi:IS30 family transposase
VWGQVCRRLRAWWSPEQIAGRFRQAGADGISYQTIYRRIQEDQLAGGTLYQCLRRFGWPRQRRRSPRAGRPLHARPGYIAARQQRGHWEIDTLLGAGGGRRVW